MLDPDFLAFNLRKERSADPRAKWLQSREFRRAVSKGVDRTAIVNAVYLGAAVPIYGPVSPGNQTWHDEGATAGAFDPAEARRLLASVGLNDRDGDGRLEDGQGAPARFSILTQGGHNRERVATVIQEQLRKLGLAVDVRAGLLSARHVRQSRRPALRLLTSLSARGSTGPEPAKTSARSLFRLPLRASARS